MQDRRQTRILPFKYRSNLAFILNGREAILAELIPSDFPDFIDDGWQQCLSLRGWAEGTTESTVPRGMCSTLTRRGSGIIFQDHAFAGLVIEILTRIAPHSQEG
jgi:hypothetical protein